MTGKTGTLLAAAGMLAAHLIYMAAAGPASAMQILEAADHGELAAEVSATGVNRIALSHDRIRRVIRAPGGFETEHDPETGDLWLRPVVAGQGAAAEGSGGAPVILFIGTEKGFTYRLTLTPSARESAQILIRNGAALARAEAAAQTAGADPRIGVRGGPRVAALVGLIRAVARREPPAGYAIETGPGRPSAACRSSRPGGGPAVRGACRRKRRRRGEGRGPRRDHGTPDRGGMAGGARERPLGRTTRGDRDRRLRTGRRHPGRRVPGRPAMSAGAGVDGDAGAVRRRQLVLFSVIAAVVLAVLAVWLTAGGGGGPRRWAGSRPSSPVRTPPRRCGPGARRRGWGPSRRGSARWKARPGVSAPRTSACAKNSPATRRTRAA